jgi:hypothetical protein
MAAEEATRLSRGDDVCGAVRGAVGSYVPGPRRLACVDVRLGAVGCVRPFVVFRDCARVFDALQTCQRLCHARARVRRSRANQRWRHDHAIHHASSGDLARRGVGDIVTRLVTASRIPRAVVAAAPWRPGPAQPNGDVRTSGPCSRWWSRRVSRPEPSGHEGSTASLPQTPRSWSLAGSAGERVGEIPSRVVARGDARRLGRDLAVLCPAPVRRRVLAEPRRLGLHRRGAAAQLVPEAAELLHFFIGNMGLHHVHHLNDRVPNYDLQRARRERDLPSGAEAIDL